MVSQKQESVCAHALFKAVMSVVLRRSKWTVNAIVDMLLRLPESNIEVPGFKSQLFSQFQLQINAHPLRGCRQWLKFVGPCSSHGRPGVSS